MLIIINILILNTLINILSTAMKDYNLHDATASIALGARSSSPEMLQEILTVKLGNTGWYTLLLKLDY